MMKYVDLHTLRLLMEGASVIDVARLRDTHEACPTACIPNCLNRLYPTLSRNTA